MEKQTMTTDKFQSSSEAYKILEQVCTQFRGTLQEHQTIQQALKILKPEEPAQQE